MPLFAKKFEPKPAPVRSMRCNIGCPAIKEDLDYFRNVSLNLGNKEYKFVDGNWMLASKKSNFDDIGGITKKLKLVEEENNLNKVKVEVLLDLLAENVSELNALREENV